MSSRLDPEPVAAFTPVDVPVSAPAPAPLPVAFDPDLEFGHALPSDHPPWTADAVSVSARARALLERLRPIALRVLSFWHHRVRAIVVAGSRVSIDASGCYRME